MWPEFVQRCVCWKVSEVIMGCLNLSVRCSVVFCFAKFIPPRVLRWYWGVEFCFRRAKTLVSSLIIFSSCLGPKDDRQSIFIKIPRLKVSCYIKTRSRDRSGETLVQLFQLLRENILHFSKLRWNAQTNNYPPVHFWIQEHCKKKNPTEHSCKD